VENLEQIHAKKKSRKEKRILEKNQFLKKKTKVNHNIQADRKNRKGKRQTEQISALSTVDGSIEGYGGYDG